MVGDVEVVLAWQEEPVDEEEEAALVPCFERWEHQAGNQQEALNKGKLINSETVQFESISPKL